MSHHNLKQSVIALAVVQAFAIPAHAAERRQTMPEVVVTGSQSVATDRASVGGFSDTPLLQTPGLDHRRSAASRCRTSASATPPTPRKFDASVSDSYNAVGYAEQFSIRGFDAR